MNQDALLSSYQFHLPQERIAQRPAERRDASRLMALAADGGIVETVFSELPNLLEPGDLLVRNNAKVLPARLIGRRAGGGVTEMLLVRPGEYAGEEAWYCLARPASHLKAGKSVVFGDGELTAAVLAKEAGGAVWAAFSEKGERFRAALERVGRLPLPPYIERPDRTPTREDVERYQTAYAKKEGAVAAPTAGLHFTPELDERLRERGVDIAEITLHVGPGTFRPIKADNLDDHVMDAERYEIPTECWRAIREARDAKRRVVAVGTTTARSLEAAALSELDGETVLDGWTSLFIRPGHRFRLVDGLVTNFHLPGSSLLVLISALAGRERILASYERAVAGGYRFYSYGDAMLIWNRARPTEHPE